MGLNFPLTILTPNLANISLPNGYHHPVLPADFSNLPDFVYPIGVSLSGPFCDIPATYIDPMLIAASNCFKSSPDRSRPTAFRP